MYSKPETQLPIPIYNKIQRLVSSSGFLYVQQSQMLLFALLIDLMSLLSFYYY